MKLIDLNGLPLEISLIFLFALSLYVILIRPQLKRAKIHTKHLLNISSGNTITTNGGLVGIVKSVTGDLVDVEFAEGIVLKVKKNMINNIIQN